MHRDQEFTGIFLFLHDYLRVGLGGNGRAFGMAQFAIPAPLRQCFGMVMANLVAVAHGAAMVFPSGAFGPSETLRTVEAERCASLYGVPTMFIGRLLHPEFDRLSSLRAAPVRRVPSR